MVVHASVFLGSGFVFSFTFGSRLRRRTRNGEPNIEPETPNGTLKLNTN
jgi:hypothetical protein